MANDLYSKLITSDNFSSPNPTDKTATTAAVGAIPQELIVAATTVGNNLVVDGVSNADTAQLNQARLAKTTRTR